MKKIAFYIFIISLLVGCGGDNNVDETNTPPPPITGTSDTINAFDAPAIGANIKQAYLDAVNNARSVKQDCGERGNMPATTPLVWNDALYRAAYSHSEDMAESNTFSHTGSGADSDWTAQILSLGRGSTFQERIKTNGYTGHRTIGENLMAGTNIDTAKKAVTGWLKSDGHCANLMNPKFEDMGMAHVENSTARFTHYWTHKFAAKL